ncbi:MAG: cell division protein FtsQ/DivIB [Thermomicrobiales bacterium]
MSGAESGRRRPTDQRGAARAVRPASGARTASDRPDPRRRTTARQQPTPTGRRRAHARAGRWRAAWRGGRLAALLAALALSGVLGYLLIAGAFSVRQLDSSGTALTTPAELAVTGGALGQNIFAVDPQDVAQRLVGLPAIQHAEVSLALPDRLVVRVVERQPALVWQVGADRFLLDASGMVIAENPPANFVQDVPGVTVHDLAAPVVGDRVDQGPVDASLAVARRAGQFGLHATALDYTPATGLTLGLAGAPPVVIDSAARLDDKLAAVVVVLHDDPEHGRGWKVLNVTDPDRPFYTTR